MYRILLSLILLITPPLLLGGNDVWQTLFKEKLREANQGNSQAQYDVGSMYQKGRGVAPDRDKAVEWYRKSAAQNNSKAAIRLKLLQANVKRFEKTLAQADTGDAESQYKLGNMYTKGIGVRIDHSIALAAYNKAAEQGFTRAEYQLGLNYYDGTSVRANKRKAYQWFKVAADKDHPAAQYYLGKLFASGQGVKRNYSTSLVWLGKAVDGGFDQARAEMIDVSEQMIISKQAKSVPVNSSGKDKPVQAAKITPVREKLAKKVTLKAWKKPVRVVATKTKNRKKQTSFAIEDLVVALWSRNNKPVAYLPSAINNCRTENSDIICYSNKQTRQTPSNTIKFKTKSILSNFSKDGSFEVNYRNLVISATPKTTTFDPEDDSEVGDNQTDSAGAYTVKTGWGNEHTLNCNMVDRGTVSCVKNKTHTFILKSPQTVASGK